VTDSQSEAVYARRWWILAVLCLSLLIIVLDNSILNVALPTLVVKLNASTSELQWIVDAYTLIFAGVLLAAGSHTDRYGRKKGLVFGMCVFGTGSILSALAGSTDHLIVTRAIMGFGASFIMPATLSILTNVFPPKERGRAIGIWAAMAGIGVPMGPLLGGFLLEHFYWGSIFLVNVPIVVTSLISAYILIPDSRTPDVSPFDPVGVVLSIAGLSTFVYATIEAPTNGWTSTLTLSLFVFAGIALLLFAIWELRSRRPMLDLSLFKNPRFSSASLAVGLVFFALFGSLFVLTQYLQNVLGYSPFGAGLRLVPAAIGITIGAPLSSRIAERIGAKIPVAFGLAVTACGFAMLSTADAESTYLFVAGALFLFSAGMGLAMTPATNAIMGAVPRDNAGIGAAINDTTRQVGGAFGVAVIGSILSTSYRGSIEGALAQLPAQAAQAARESIGGATQVALQLGGQPGEALSTAANDAFVQGMHEAFLLAAGVALASSLLALLFLPAFGPEEERVDRPEQRRRSSNERRNAAGQSTVIRKT
jgi:EmrB/QacA subfamily drug resistance transporter